SCHYDLRTGTGTRLRLGQWYPSPFAARQAQGALLERTPQDSMIVSRPPAVRRPAMERLRATQLGLFAAPQSASSRLRPVPVDRRRTSAASCGDAEHYMM